MGKQNTLRLKMYTRKTWIFPSWDSKKWVRNCAPFALGFYAPVITKSLSSLTSFLWKLVEMWGKLPLNMGASTHTFKYRWCWGPTLNCSCHNTISFIISRFSFSSKHHSSQIKRYIQTDRNFSGTLSLINLPTFHHWIISFFYL